MIPGGECLHLNDKRENRMFLHFLTFILLLKNLNQEIDLSGDGTLFHWMRDNDVTPRTGIGNHELNVASRWRHTTQPAMHIT